MVSLTTLSEMNEVIEKYRVRGYFKENFLYI